MSNPYARFVVAEPTEKYGAAPSLARMPAPWMVYRRDDGDPVLLCGSKWEAEAQAAALNADVRAQREKKEGTPR